MGKVGEALRVAQKGAFTIAEKKLANKAIEDAIKYLQGGHFSYSCSAVTYALRGAFRLGSDEMLRLPSSRKVGQYTRVNNKIFNGMRKLGLEPGRCDAFDEFYKNPSLGSPIQARIIWLTTLNHLIQLEEI